MATTFSIKQHDTYPNLVIVLKENGSIVDLTNATSATLVMEISGRKTCSILVPKTDGKVMYDWDALDTATNGTEKAEIEISWPGGIQTFPNNGYFDIIVVDDLDT